MGPIDRRAGLRRILAAGLAPLVARHALADTGTRFALGVASGSPTANGVVLWTRLVGDIAEPAVEVRWQVAEDASFARIAAQGVDVARADEAYTVHAEATGLRPAREYWYRFDAAGERSAVGRTRTAPPPGAPVQRLDFAIASCQRWDHGHWAAWRDIAERPPDLVLFLGDYIYEYASPPLAPRHHEGGAAVSLAQYRARYAQYRSDPALQAAHAACPWLVIWDDHEVENDYAGLQGAWLQPDFAPRRAAAYRAWWEHMPLARALRPREAGGGQATIHGRLDWGRLARLHWLDGRQHRDPQPCPQPGRGGSRTVRERDCPARRDPARSLLGAAQERWLAEGWSLDHPWNLLAQTTLMAPLARVDDAHTDPEAAAYWTDGWDGYPAARARLLGTVAERRVPGAVVLSGDVHANIVAELHADAAEVRSPLVASEFCGTSISSRGMPQARLDAMRAANPHLRYARSDQRGTVRFTLTPARLDAELRVVADVLDAASTVDTAARFAVERGSARVRPA